MRFLARRRRAEPDAARLDAVNSREPELLRATDGELAASVAALHGRADGGAELDELREVARRELGERAGG